MGTERTQADFEGLLDRYADAGADERPAIEREIRDRYEETLAILVLDMCGFSRAAERHGILHFLARVSQMRAVAVPAITQHDGELVKYIADDVMAAFPTPDKALAAALEIRAATAVSLGITQTDMTFQVCMGIGYGPTLHVPGSDLWGTEVNQAFKLGEDTADAGEILLTAAAFTALEMPPKDARRIEVDVSGVRLEAYSV